MNLFLIYGGFGTEIYGSNIGFQNFQITLDEKVVYTKVGLDQIYNFVIEKIFILDHYGYKMGHIRHLKVMLKYLISSYM